MERKKFGVGYKNFRLKVLEPMNLKESGPNLVEREIEIILRENNGVPQV